MPKYYDELSELEKSAIIYRKFETGVLHADDGRWDVVREQVESYFYAPDVSEISAQCRLMIIDGENNYDGIENKRLGDYTYYSNDLRRKVYVTDLKQARYFTTTSAINYSSLYPIFNVYIIDSDGSYLADEEPVWSDPFNSNGGTVYNDPFCVVPFCDIKGDTLVMKDTDGYWKIVEVPEYALSITEESLEVSVKSTVRLTVYSIVPAGATLEWSSDDEGVATVTDGVVTCRGIGKATITASIKKDNTTLISDSCTVIVGEVHI